MRFSFTMSFSEFCEANFKSVPVDKLSREKAYNAWRNVAKVKHDDLCALSPFDRLVETTPGVFGRFST